MNRLLVVLLFALLSLTSSPSVVCAQVTSVRTSSHTVYLYGNLRSFKPLLGTRTVEQGLDLVTLTLESNTHDTLPAGLTLAFSHPIVDVQSN
jgi:hypothetical protein